MAMFFILVPVFTERLSFAHDGAVVEWYMHEKLLHGIMQGYLVTVFKYRPNETLFHAFVPGNLRTFNLLELDAFVYEYEIEVRPVTIEGIGSRSFATVCTTEGSKLLGYRGRLRHSCFCLHLGKRFTKLLEISSKKYLKPRRIVRLTVEWFMRRENNR